MSVQKHGAGVEKAVTPDRIHRICHGYQLTATLKTGVSLGVFDQIADGTSDAAGIAAAIGADARATKILLDALVAIGLLVRSDAVYGLAPDAETFLIAGRPEYIGDTFDVLASRWHWDRFGRLAEAVRKGGSVFADDAETPGHPFWEEFAMSYRRASAPSAEALADIVRPWASRQRPLGVLDLACGGGYYAITLGSRYDHAHLTLLDWPNILAIARRAIDDAGMGVRARYLPGDMFDVQLDGPYDLVVASRVFHHFSEERCIALLQRLCEALKPAGKIAIHDFALSEAYPADEPAAHLFSLMMLVWTRQGQSYSIADYERMLAAAGFEGPSVHDVRRHPTRWLLARREG